MSTFDKVRSIVVWSVRFHQQTRLIGAATCTGSIQHANQWNAIIIAHCAVC